MEYIQRLLGEVRLLSKLDHPNIVRYYQAWIEDPDPNDESFKFSEDFMFGESQSSSVQLGNYLKVIYNHFRIRMMVCLLLKIHLRIL